MPTSTRFDDLQLNITKMAGWVAASEDVRERIARAATKFLQDGVSTVESWLGTGSFNRSDLSAYRAFFC